MYYSFMYYYVFFNLGNYALYCVDWTIRSCCHISKAGNFVQEFLDHLKCIKKLEADYFNNSVLGIPYLVTISKIFLSPTDVGEECLLHTSPRSFLSYSQRSTNFLVKRHLRQCKSVITEL